MSPYRLACACLFAFASLGAHGAGQAASKADPSIAPLLEELGLAYEIRAYKRDAKTMLAPPELKAVHPLGKSPVVTVDDPLGPVTLAESGAIIEQSVCPWHLLPSTETFTSPIPSGQLW